MTEADGRPLLEVEGLEVSFPGTRPVRAVRGISYAIQRGEVLGLVGESGSGKSVSAMAVMGLLPRIGARATGGTIRFLGKDLSHDDPSQRGAVRGDRISIVFQDPSASLDPVLTIGRQVTEVLETHRGLRGAPADLRARELLELVEIPMAARRMRQHPHELSGGMRQRVMIAIALACEPDLLIADEPTTALDVTIQAQVLDLLGRLRESLRMAILLITHDLGAVAVFADRVAVMYAGRIVEVGTTEEVLARPAHHYTLGLLRSIPRLDLPRLSVLDGIEGTPPDMSLDLPGCAFAPRCPAAVPECLQQRPLLRQVDQRPGSTVACHAPLVAAAGAG